MVNVCACIWGVSGVPHAEKGPVDQVVTQISEGTS